MRQSEFADQSLERAGFLEGIEILSLNILDERHRNRRFVRNPADNRRYFGQTGLI